MKKLLFLLVGVGDQDVAVKKTKQNKRCRGKKKKGVSGVTVRIRLVMRRLCRVAMVTGFIFPHNVVLDACGLPLFSYTVQCKAPLSTLSGSGLQRKL